jgi:enoyl-CoA hydratase/isomerase-like protein
MGNKIIRERPRRKRRACLRTRATKPRTSGLPRAAETPGGTGSRVADGAGRPVRLAALRLNRARQLEITNGSFTAQQALEWGAIAEVVPLDEVLPRAQAIAEQIMALPQLTSRYMAVLFRQRISRRLAEGTLLGMALEALTAANLAYLQPA